MLLKGKVLISLHLFCDNAHIFKTKTNTFLGVIGRASLINLSQHREKRQTESLTRGYELVLKTSENVLLGQNENRFHLMPSSFPLIGPNFKLVIREGNSLNIVINETVPMPNCLFNGTFNDAQLAVSTCGGHHKMVGVRL